MVELLLLQAFRKMIVELLGDTGLVVHHPPCCSRQGYSIAFNKSCVA